MLSNLIKKIVSNNGTTIEYYVNNQVNDKPTLIISMGVWEPAFRAFPLIARLSGIHCIVLTYRGRSGSSTPATGYDWEHHASDLAAVIGNETINSPIFLGFSKGVSYMLGYLSTKPELTRGIIIIDYPALHIKSESGYAELWGNMKYNGLKLNDYITTVALEGIEKESTNKDFYTDLGKVTCPVWVFKGNNSEASIPSNLTDEDMLRYKTSVNKLEVIYFNHSGHMILDEELGKASKYIRQILESAS